MSTKEDGEEYKFTRPIAASQLPDYTNKEQDTIKQAFSPAAFISLTSLPASLSSGKLLAHTKSLRESTRKGNLDPKFGEQIRRKGGLFSEFKYVPSKYGLLEELQKQERLASDAKRLEVGGKDFIVSSAQSRKLKYEDGFGNKDYRYPYLNDPYDGAKDQASRMKWLEDSKILHGAFLPGGKSRGFAQVSKSTLPDAIRAIHKTLIEDWEDAKFEVITSEFDLVVIRFALDTVPEEGLRAYMNVFSNSSEGPIEKYQLARVLEDWARKPDDGHIYFVYRPPWVKTNPSLTYFALHPEERSFHTSHARTLKTTVPNRYIREPLK